MIISLVKLILYTTITHNLQEFQKIYVIVKQKHLLLILHSNVNEKENFFKKLINKGRLKKVHLQVIKPTKKYRGKYFQIIIKFDFKTYLCMLRS